MKKEKDALRQRGRPRKFDREHVLDRAVITFWENGYSGSSLDALTESMGINRPSLYSTFGSKHELFMDAIDRYADLYGCKPVEALNREEDIVKAVAAFLATRIACVTARDGPTGCLVANVAAEEAETDARVRKKLSKMFLETDNVIAERLRTAQAEGQISQQVNPPALAQIIVSITHSFATRARVGASREELSALAKEFMLVLFPSQN